MENQDFTTTINVDQTPQDVFLAINNVCAWWSENIEGDTAALNSEFDYHYKDVHRCRIKITEFVPGVRVVWHVIHNYFNFTNDKSEWTNTNIIFRISRHADKTELQFTHEGLVRQYECYDVCHEAWTHYIQDSLKELIVTGKGKPTTREGENFNDELIEKWEIEK